MKGFVGYAFNENLNSMKPAKLRNKRNLNDRSGYNVNKFKLLRLSFTSKNRKELVSRFSVIGFVRLNNFLRSFSFSLTCQFLSVCLCEK